MHIANDIKWASEQGIQHSVILDPCCHQENFVPRSLSGTYNWCIPDIRGEQFQRFTDRWWL